MDVGLARLETARRRVASRAVPPLSKDASSHGFAMAALLTAMSIMAIALAAALPAWQQTMQREKEEELVFRGEQYSHAIALFQRTFVNSAPRNIDVIVEQRFLRKKDRDPITNDDFVPISITPQTGGSAAQAGTQAGRGRGGANTPVANEPGGTFLNRLRRGAGRGSGQRGASGPAEGRHTAAPDGRETGR